jgi:hypothetical protein
MVQVLLFQQGLKVGSFLCGICTIFLPTMLKLNSHDSTFLKP